MLRLALALTILAGCPAPRPPVQPVRPVGTPEPQITWKRVETANDVPTAPPPGTYQIHMIDVGTGLAILVRGADFTLLYDAGTNDREEKPMRVAAYLAATLGPSGDDLCGAPAEQKKAIDHVVLSHPHLDHASALDLVLHCYDVANFWDSGRVNDTVFYRELLSGIAQKAAINYRTAADVPKDRTVQVKGLAVTMPRWQRFGEGESVRLGEGAKFTILHAEGKAKHDPNQNSVVVAVELGGIRLLL